MMKGKQLFWVLGVVTMCGLLIMACAKQQTVQPAPTVGPHLTLVPLSSRIIHIKIIH